jgi:hypothetical protein
VNSRPFAVGRRQDRVGVLDVLDRLGLDARHQRRDLAPEFLDHTDQGEGLFVVGLAGVVRQRLEGVHALVERVLHQPELALAQVVHVQQLVERVVVRAADEVHALEAQEADRVLEHRGVRARDRAVGRRAVHLAAGMAPNAPTDHRAGLALEAGQQRGGHRRHAFAEAERVGQVQRLRVLRALGGDHRAAEAVDRLVLVADQHQAALLREHDVGRHRVGVLIWP